MVAALLIAILELRARRRRARTPREGERDKDAMSALDG
jgi:hypothetical protein